MNIATITVSLCLFNCVTCFTSGFMNSPIVKSSYRDVLALNAIRKSKPKFSKATDRWEPPDGYDQEETYGPVGSLLRQGPAPFITRLTKADEYEQAVLKYMASEDVSRIEAQGNMDAYFNNAADWAYRKMEEKRGAPKVDYNKIKTKDVTLALIWALMITPLLLRIVFLIVVTGNWDVTVDQIADFSN